MKRILEKWSEWIVLVAAIYFGTHILIWVLL